MSKLILVLLISLLSITSYPQSGWIISEQIRGEDVDDVAETTLFIQDNKIRSSDKDHSLIVDLVEWQLTILEHKSKGYWKGTPSLYLEYVKRFTLDLIKEEMAGANDHDMPYLEALYEDLIMDIRMGSDVVSFIGELSVEVIMTNELDRILEYPVNHFIVYLDGRRVEEVWLSRDIKFRDIYDYAKFREFKDEMSWGYLFQDYRSSEKYIHLLNQGLPMKTVEFDEVAEISITRVIAVENTVIDEVVFKIPLHYRQMESPPETLLF